MSGYYSTTVYEVEKNYQTLLEGDWGSDDCRWDWRTHHSYHESYTDAEREFKRAKVTKDCPIIRLYETAFNEYGQIEDRELLEEKF